MLAFYMCNKEVHLLVIRISEFYVVIIICNIIFRCHVEKDFSLYFNIIIKTKIKI